MWFNYSNYMGNNNNLRGFCRSPIQVWLEVLSTM